MTLHMYIHMGSNISGESNHRVNDMTGVIDVLAWSWGMCNNDVANIKLHKKHDKNTMKPRANFMDISFTKYIDSASSDLMTVLAGGFHIRKCILVVRKSGRGQRYIEITMENVLISSISIGGSGGEDRLTENVTLNFSKVKFNYIYYRYGLAVEENFIWDIANNMGWQSSNGNLKIFNKKSSWNFFGNIRDLFSNQQEIAPMIDIFENIVEVLIAALSLRIIVSPDKLKQYATQIYELIFFGDSDGAQRNLKIVPDVLDLRDEHKLLDMLRTLFAGIPHQWHIRNSIGNNEGCYCAIVYAYFLDAGLDVVGEVSVSTGRIDLIVKMQRQIYLFDFKVVEDNEGDDAQEQIASCPDVDKYRVDGLPILLVRVDFSRHTHSVERCALAII